MKISLLIMLLTVFISAPVLADDDDERRVNRFMMERHFYNLFQAMKQLNDPYLNKSDDNEDQISELAENDSAGHSALSANSGWVFEAFMIRIRPKFGFKIPGMGSLAVVPETEIFWAKE